PTVCPRPRFPPRRSSDLPADWRAELQPRHSHRKVRELDTGEHLVEFGLQSVASLQILGHDDELGDEVIVELNVEREIEADRSAADVARIACDILVPVDKALDAVDLLPGR